MKAIEIKQISKKYGKKFALNNVSFSVKKGSIHGFIGPNGAGKSTLLNSLARMVLLKSGKVYIEGKWIEKEPGFNQNLGCIFSNAPFFPGMTVKECVEDCIYLRNISTPEAFKKFASSPLAKFRYRDFAVLSTGWKKILYFFILRLYQPKLLLLDEPFSGLDPSWRQIFFDALKKIREEGGTILISTHVLSDLQKLADDITIIREGKIIYTGPKTDDIEKTYKKFFFEEDLKKKII